MKFNNQTRSEDIVVVKEKNLSNYIKTWKSDLLNSGKIDRLQEIRKGFVKPSTKRRHIIENAKHREKYRMGDLV